VGQGGEFELLVPARIEFLERAAHAGIDGSVATFAVDK
jgi:hypothetical protein